MARFDYLLIDADNHYYEVDDCFSRHLPTSMADQAIHLIDSGDEVRPKRWALGDRVVSFLPGNPADAVAPPGEFADFFAGRGPMVMKTVIKPKEVPAYIGREGRLQLLDEQGLEAAIVLPTIAVLVESDFSDRPDVLCANYRSFNRWLEEDWGYGADGRVFAAPILTLLDLSWAIDELERIATLGAKLFYIKTGPVNGRSPADPSFDPFWARVQEIGIKPAFHIGDSGFPELYAKHWGEPVGRTLLEFSPLQHLLCNGERPISDTLAAIILHNLFGRFPGIEVLSLEHGSGWVRPLLRSMDHAAMVGARGAHLGGALPALPSETFANHVSVAPYHEDDIAGLVELIGAGRVLLGSDFPHPEGIADPASFLDGVTGLSAADERLIMRSNSARLLGLSA